MLRTRQHMLDVCAVKVNAPQGIGAQPMLLGKQGLQHGPSLFTAQIVVMQVLLCKAIVFFPVAQCFWRALLLNMPHASSSIAGSSQASCSSSRNTSGISPTWLRKAARWRRA